MTMASTIAALAREFHDEGFVALDRATYGLTDADVARIATAVQRRYDQFMAVAKSHTIDLSDVASAERIPGFYVRQGGRIDMELVNVLAERHPNLPDARSAAQSLVVDVEPVDKELFYSLETHWEPIVDTIFRIDTTISEYELEYIGCVVARPGDRDQNWHLDGVHRNLTHHEPADRLNVFVPLVEITPEIGGTEMKRRSQFHDKGARGAAFEDYADLESVTHYVAAGTPVVMDYRVWHRGLANGSDTVLRSLLYFKYTRKTMAKRVSEATANGMSTKEKKRVTLVSVISKSSSS